jgi:hypothetical protein
VPNEDADRVDLPSARTESDAAIARIAPRVFACTIALALAVIVVSVIVLAT